MNFVIILPLFLLVMLTDRFGLATRSESRTIFYDEVQVTVFDDVSSPVSIDGASYPSIARQDYPRLYDCGINIGNPGDCRSPLPEFDDCTVVYYEERNCNATLIQLVERVKERGGRAVIFRTEHVSDQLRRLESVHTVNVSQPVILVEDVNFTIRQYENEVFVKVNITQISQTSLPTRPPSDNNERSTTALSIVLSVLIVLLLVSVVMVGLAIFMCYRRHRDRTRLVVS